MINLLGKPVVFEENEKGFVGFALVRNKPTVTHFVRREECGLYSLRVSVDGGRSYRLLPRLGCETDAACYYETAEAAMKEVNNI